MGWTILSKTNRVMGHNIDNSGFTQGRDPHSSSHVISENKESSTVWNESWAVQSNAVANGTHSMLPDSKSDIALLRRILLEVTKHLKQCHVGGCKISTSSKKTRNNFSKCI
uniref:Uncharacterized protein n=1 Tax=Oryza punctata TaxID=4537 RepID=A0A0E0L7E4_ORYPU